MFGYLLKAFYNQSYRIRDFDQFDKLVGMADYYCGLPILSRSLDLAMSKSYFFSWRELNKHALTVINLAVKLRNATLFRECIIHLSGPWHKPCFWNIADTKLYKLRRMSTTRFVLNFTNSNNHYINTHMRIRWL